MRIYLFFILFVFVFSSCENNKVKVNKITIINPSDFEEIKNKGELIVLTENTSTSYFNYRGQQMGFEHDILSDFADSFNLKLKIIVVNNSKNFATYLRQGKGDIIACNYTITKSRKKLHSFSFPYLKERLVLVQRKNKNPPIRDIKKIHAQQIHLRAHSSYYQVLKAIEKKNNISFNLKELKGDIPTEDYIDLVAKGEINYTVSEDNIARLCALTHSNVDIKTYLSKPMPIAFGLRLEDTQFKDTLDCWLEDYVNSNRYNNLVSLYFRVFDTSFINDKLKNINKISIYDSLFKVSGQKHQVDWILMSSIAYQETRFNPSAIGLGGSYSMMQFMPNTGPGYGVFEDSPVEVQIDGGTRMIKKLLNKYKNVLTEEDQIKFALAAYNAGYCHVNDAMKLAGKYDLNPYLWEDNVKKMMLNLSSNKYYTDPATRCGAYRGLAVKYADEVFNRYKKWKSQYK